MEHEDLELQAMPGVGRAATRNLGRGPRRGNRIATSGFAVGVITLLAVVPACSSPSTPAAVSTPTSTSHPTTTSTSAPSSVSFQQGSAAELAACQSDAKTLETALEAYMAENGAYPSPPSPWSAADYAANFQPLTSATGGGPYLPTPPGTKFYVIEYDSSGHIWIAPPGAYNPTYNPGQDFDAHPDICLAAVG